jgi:hypothetical protein
VKELSLEQLKKIEQNLQRPREIERKIKELDNFVEDCRKRDLYIYIYQ